MFFYKIIKFIQSIPKKIDDVRKRQGWMSFCEHGVPVDWAFEHYGAVFQGGICPTCGKLNQGKFLGNVTGMYEVIGGKIVPCCNGKPVSYFRKLGWQIGFIV